VVEVRARSERGYFLARVCGVCAEPIARRLHAAVIKARSSSFGGHISRDATALKRGERAAKESEKAKGLPKIKRRPRKKGEPKQTLDALGAATKHEPGGDARGLPRVVTAAAKRNSKGFLTYWEGTNCISCSDGGLPISCLTSASVNDSQVACRWRR